MNTRQKQQREVDLEAYYEATLQYLIGAEEQSYELPWSEIKAQMAECRKWDEDGSWGYYIHPNPNDYLRKVARRLRLNKEDVLLDIGAGDARLCLIALQEFGIRRAYAIELNARLCEFAESHIGNRLDGRLTIHPLPYQEFPFPQEVTKAAFIAWHNGPKTLQKALEKLSQTECQLLVHNFRNPKVLQVIRLETKR